MIAVLIVQSTLYFVNFGDLMFLLCCCDLDAIALH